MSSYISEMNIFEELLEENPHLFPNNLTDTPGPLIVRPLLVWI